MELSLLLDDGGVGGQTEIGQDAPGVHHLHYLAPTNRRGTHVISVCFTLHYRRMPQRFGDHLGDGLARDNVLVANAATISPDGPVDGVEIQTAYANRSRIEALVAATACPEVARSALRFHDGPRPDCLDTEDLAFLDGSRLGFYPIQRGGSAWVSVGDPVVPAPR